MQADNSLVAYIAATYYNLSPIFGSIKSLCGYSDKNFQLTDSNDRKTYVLKIVNRDESIVEVTEIVDEIVHQAHAHCNALQPATSPFAREPSFLVPKLVRTTGDKLSTYTSVRYNKSPAQLQHRHGPSNGGHPESSVEMVKCNIKLFEYFDGTTMFDYINGKLAAAAAGHRAPAGLKGEQLYRKLGRVCNELFVFLRTQRHLLDRLKRARGNSFPWQLKSCETHLRRLLERLYPEQTHARRLLVEQVLLDYAQEVGPQLDRLPEFILHGDLCNKNLLLNWELNSTHRDKVCLIDFQDLQVGQQVVDLAILMFYNVLEQEQMPFEEALKLIPHWIFLGYQSNGATMCSLNTGELLLVPTLMKLRLCQSLLNGQLAFEENPENAYVMHTNQRGWQLLELMSDKRGDFADPSKLVSFWLNE